MSSRFEKTKASKLKDFCSITSSKRIYAADYVEDGIPFVRGKEVVQRFLGSGRLESDLFISPTKFETLRDRFGAPSLGDLLLTSVGTLGVLYLVTDGDEFYFKDGNLIWFRNFDGLNSRFFYYWLQSRAGRAQLAKCTIGTSQAAYTIERLREIEAPKHSNDQQERVADILFAHDDLIENNRRRIALLEEAARLLYREWFVRFRFPGHEHAKIIDGIPQGWKRFALSDLADFVNGYPFKPAHLGDVGLPIVKIPELKHGVTNKTPRNSGALIPEKYRLKDGDLIFSWSGTLAANVWASGPALLNQHLFHVIPGNRVGRGFLMCALREALTDFNNQTVGATMKHIRRSALGQVFVALPDRAETSMVEETLHNTYAQLK